ncbi:MAG: ribosome-binding factor A [Gammaproteobacteria bacterium]|nr:ribosome-binding factor A [Gammaproteobacteria bacterium]
MPKDYPRTRRVGEQIQRELAMLVREEIKDPRLGMTTVSAVHVSRDFSHAKVYVTVLGDAGVQHQSLEVLRRAAGFLRRELGRRMLIRTVPELHFVYDESIERGSRLDALIEQAVTEDKARHRD